MLFAGQLISLIRIIAIYYQFGVVYVFRNNSSFVVLISHAIPISREEIVFIADAGSHKIEKCFQPAVIYQIPGSRIPMRSSKGHWDGTMQHLGVPEVAFSD
jgi:hypothetical protein